MSDITVVITSISARLDDFFLRALESVVTQTRKPDAIVIAIDHEHDGAAKTRNRGLAMAQTEWVAFLDDDDYLYASHLESLEQRQLETGADIVYPWFDTEPSNNDPFPMHEGREYDPNEPHMFPITTLVRRQLALDVGGFPEDYQASEICAGEDWVFWLSMRNAGAKFAHFHGRTWVWRMHGSNTSGLGNRW